MCFYILVHIIYGTLMVRPDDFVTLNVVMFTFYTFYVLLFYRDFFSFDSVPTNWPGQKKSH